MRYSLNVKSLPGGGIPTSAAPASNPSMQRQGTVPMDTGREWSGDQYDEGEVSDPAQAFAHFQGDGETEAWLDRSEDGTLIGWVRDGTDIYRYPDAEAWALDVDGAQMQRTDDGSAPADGEQAAAPGAPAAAPGQDRPVVPGGGQLQQQPDAFVNEPDPAGDFEAQQQAQAQAAPNDEPPTADPQALDAQEPLDPAKHAAPESVVTPDGQEEWDNPFAEALDEAADAAPGDGDGPDNESDPADQAQDQTDESGKRKVPPPVVGKRKRKVPPPKFEKKVLSGRVQVKHMPGQHNQEDHGNWADDGIKSAAESIAHAAEKAADAASSIPGGGSSSRPKGGEPTKGSGSSKAPKKATLSAKSIKALSDEDLAAITESGDLYDMPTMEAAAQEFDDRHPIDDMTRGFAKHTEPGSPERQALFDAVVPQHWARWAAQGAKGKKPKRNKREQIQMDYLDYVNAQYLRASEATAGNFIAKAARQRAKEKGYDEFAFFNGRVSSSEFKHYASEELQRFFAQPGEQRMTFSDYAAEFYPSYAKAKAKVGSRYISEFG